MKWDYFWKSKIFFTYHIKQNITERYFSTHPFSLHLMLFLFFKKLFFWSPTQKKIIFNFNLISYSCPPWQCINYVYGKDTCCQKKNKTLWTREDSFEQIFVFETWIQLSWSVIEKKTVSPLVSSLLTIRIFNWNFLIEDSWFRFFP